MSTKTKLNTPQFRVAFPAVFEAKYNTLSKKNEFSVVALFPKGADLSKLKAAAQEAITKTFGNDKKKWPKNLKSPFRDQGDRAKTNDEGEEVLPQGYVKGAIYINLKSSQRPGVVDQNVEEMIDSSDFYGGCWAIASVNAFAYDKVGKGVSFGLGNLQKVRDDKAFGNRTKPQEDFSAVASPDSDNDESALDMLS